MAGADGPAVRSVPLHVGVTIGAMDSITIDARTRCVLW
ncbi:hypothetical protein KPATCC21470_1161 [Kitasatospora purpeofusca]